MNTKNLFLLALLIAVSVIIGCSSNGIAPASPNPADASVYSRDDSHQCWGVWQFTADPDAGTLEVAPIRAGSMHVNVLPFLEPPAFKNLSLEHLEFVGDQVIADIGLRHPFLGLNEFTGFDVCGILITAGALSGFDDPDIEMAGEGDTRLVNYDGFTRWWNPAEFPVNLGTMFSYNDGLLGTADAVGHYNSTLNGYKYYTDGLGAQDDLSAADPLKRGVFSAGKQNIRRFIIQLDAGLVFNYAIDANWQFPQDGSPWVVPDDFGPAANRPEAWRIEAHETFNSLYNDGLTSGGALGLSIDVYDHFNADMNTVKVESPGNFIAASSNTATGGGVGYSTYEIDISGATPAEGSIDLFITIECELDGYGGLLPGKTQAAYFTGSATVGTGTPFEGVFVDGDNAGDPGEDGTMAHPFDTIQEGINAAGTGDFVDIWEVFVDPYAGGDYDLPSLANDVIVIGQGWNGGSGRPELIITDPYVLASGVSDATIKNFLFTFNHTVATTATLTFFSAANSPNLTVEDCKFTGITKAAQSYMLSFSGCADLLIEHNEFVDFRNKANVNYNHGIYFLQISTGCDGAIIRHNEFHDIGYEDEGDNTTYNNTSLYLWRPTANDVSFLNNLVYDIKDYSNSTAVGYKYNYITIMNLPGGTTPASNLVCANNTVDDMSEVAMGDPAVGAAKFCYGYNIGDDWTFKNTILSNWNPFSGAENGHRGFWADGSTFCTVYYSNVYNIGPVGHAQVRDYVNRMLQDDTSYGIWDYQDPDYDLTPGDNYYHVQNPVLLSDDASEMGAFGGPDGDWVAPSQL